MVSISSAGELLPGCVGAAFFDGGEDGLGFVFGFDDLALLDVFFGVVEGGEDHVFDLLVGEAVGGFDFDLGCFAAALLAGGDVEDAVGVDEEFDFDAGQAGDHGRDAFEVEACEGAAVFG